MKRRIFLVSALLCMAVMAFCETVYLKDGSVLKGSIVAQDAAALTLRTDSGDLSIDKSKVDHIDYGTAAKNQPAPSAPAEKTYLRNEALTLELLPTAVSAASGYFDLQFEGQTAFARYFALNTIVEFGQVSGLTLMACNLGPQISLTGGGIGGPYLGAYPGYMELTDNYGNAVFLFDCYLRAGYQYISKGGFLCGVYTGYLLVPAAASMNGFKFGVSIGFAYASPMFKVEAKQP